jgi:hypothetical protein
VASVLEAETLVPTLDCALPAGANIPRLVTANNKMTPWNIFILSSRLARNVYFSIKNACGIRSERNQDPASER